MVPYTNDSYYLRRPSLAIPPAGVYALDDAVGLHPAMGGVKELFDTGKAALVDNRYKLLTTNIARGNFELYDLVDDPAEANNIAADKPDVARRLTQHLLKWNASVDDSFAGKDYPEGRVDPSEPQPRFWTDVEAYQPYFPEWSQRWEYESRLTKRAKK